MSSDAPVQVMVAAFQDGQGADAALDQIKAAGKERLIALDQAVVVRKDSEGRVHIKRARGVGPAAGAVIGGVTGAVVGILAGPVAWVAGIGAVVGALGGQLNRVHSSPILDELSGALKPGTSAIVATVEHTWLPELDQALAQAGAEVMTASIAWEVAAQLEAGKDVALTALGGSGGAVIGGAAADEKAAAVGGVAAAASGVAGGEVIVASNGAGARRSARQA